MKCLNDSVISGYYFLPFQSVILTCKGLITPGYVISKFTGTNKQTETSCDALVICFIISVGSFYAGEVSRNFVVLLGMIKESFSAFLQKVQPSLHFNLDYRAFTDVLRYCTATSNVNLGKVFHCLVIRLGHGSCQLVSKSVLNLYAKCKVLDDCVKLFHQLPSSDTVVWNIVLSGYAGSRVYDLDALILFRSMIVSQQPKPSPITLATILPVCARYRNLGAGRSVHCYAMKVGLDFDTLVGNGLVSMYAKSGIVSDAFSIFQGIAEKDIVSWNAIISGLLERELIGDAFDTFQCMVRCEMMPNYATLSNILPLCATLKGNVGSHFGKEIHSYVLRRDELRMELTVMNALLIFYLKSGQKIEAESLFNKMELRDVVTWNSMIAGYASNCEWLKAFELFHELVGIEMIGPDSVTIVSILPVCAHLRHLHAGRQIHGYTIHHAVLRKDTAVQNALINFYTSCGHTSDALHTFLFTSEKDIISWNCILDALSENGPGSQFISLLHCMSKEGIRPDSITILAVIRFCTTSLSIDKVKETHGISIRHSLCLGNNEPTMWNGILDAYAKCGNLDYAYKLFESMAGNKNVITCNSMISGYIQHGSPSGAEMIFQRMLERDLTTWNLMIRVYAGNNIVLQALGLVHEMQHFGIRPDAMTIMSLLPVCAQTASTRILRECHGYSIRACFEDVHLKASLLDVYSKCGNICSAYKLFLSTTRKDLVLFTAMVGGLAMHGLGEEAIQIFHSMLELGLEPDHVIITAVLSACSHAGLVHEGLEIFDSLEPVHKMKPSMEQYACVVDLLARGGKINDAYAFVCKMPVRANADIWGALLGACKIHNDVDMASAIADHLFQINSTDIGNYVAMSNLFAANARWDEVQEMRRLMRMTELKKPAGCSWIEVENRNNTFVAGDCSHPQQSFIYGTLTILDKQIKDLHGSWIELLT